MRAFFSLLVALFASSEARLLATQSDQPQSTPLNKNAQLGCRVLRAVDDVSDEERSWARINSVALTRAEAKVWLQDWVDQRKSMKCVAKQMGLCNLKEDDLLNHINFPALRKFVRMDIERRTGRKLPKGQENISFLDTVTCSASDIVPVGTGSKILNATQQLLFHPHFWICTTTEYYNLLRVRVATFTPALGSALLAGGIMWCPRPVSLRRK
ncbi:secreted RxLR effector peptide protein, putative [Phytophthora infestans T30-4]|uniref:RxLR effector protein n=1 Tax=Phytophthora infestans (strain T30-4) TaxID=403677 RepID=D0P1E0_PHYIT|nr:secreted RxLR effector peptide protein, putative [Phytophthora infestans T30-4]EEY54173.1 secreted RxLR effector peptide protein, putative [Phytophthora infestans T30-4]|eukprot:XP_002895887.1 secreted RxLR effector peptide protein, putative [Phytophthora infestans T30-4]